MTTRLATGLVVILTSALAVGLLQVGTFFAELFAWFFREECWEGAAPVCSHSGLSLLTVVALSLLMGAYGFLVLAPALGLRPSLHAALQIPLAILLPVAAVAVSVVALSDVNPREPGQMLAGRDLTGQDLRDADLVRANLDQADLSGADLSGANLARATMVGANLSSATLRGTNLGGAVLDQAVLTEVDATGADLYGASLKAADLTGAVLRRARLLDAFLGDAILVDADLREAMVVRMKVWEADFSGADLRGVDTAVSVQTPNGTHREPQVDPSWETVIWADTICPDGINSDHNEGTCVGHFALRSDS